MIESGLLRVDGWVWMVEVAEGESIQKVNKTEG